MKSCPYKLAARRKKCNINFFYVTIIAGNVAGTTKQHQGWFVYDYGPSGCAIEANVLNLWRSHFVLEEQMLEFRNKVHTAHISCGCGGSCHAYKI
jgi:hypothetical protein